jgi:DMSO/TMAO reductase YedYZ molybdopterin-dependent catalytic subunit
MILRSCLRTIAVVCCVLAAQAQQAGGQAILSVQGDVAAPLALTLAELSAMPRESVAFAEENGAKPTYEGVPLHELLKRAGIGFGREMRGRALAGYVLAVARDSYEVVFGLGEIGPELGETRILVADKRDGMLLSANQGPIQLVVPTDKAGARSVRMLERLQVVRLRK